MVIAYHSKSKTYALKRKQYSGEQHAADCPSSYEAERRERNESTPVPDSAILRLADGSTKFNLSTPTTMREPTVPQETSLVTGNQKKPAKRKTLGLLGLLSFLYQEAGFNSWSPNMYGKRRYAQLYKYLMQKAEEIVVKGDVLAHQLWMPEPYKKDDQENIEARRQDTFNKRLYGPDGRPRRMLVVGVLRKLVPTPHGIGIKLAQAPDNLIFWMNDKTAGSYQRQFGGGEDPLKQLGEGDYLLIIMTVERTERDHFFVAQVASLKTTSAYIPYSTPQERTLAIDLVDKSRYFTRPMHIEDTPGIPKPNFYLHDADIAMHIYADSSDPHAAQALKQDESYYERTDEPHWVWRLGEGEEGVKHPPLPAPADTNATPLAKQA
ncbi:MAG: hypothetical protein AMS22_12395 [Thiotrichales bacterium SG8_50]|nr:MAG: hypothetical protein AMS22_12395 [Thiotrichales bacterium SG8_50]